MVGEGPNDPLAMATERKGRQQQVVSYTEEGDPGGLDLEEQGKGEICC